jgi:hypothetical protein
MAGSLVFLAAYIFYIWTFLHNKIPPVYPLYIAPLAVMLVTAAYGFLLAKLGKKRFIRDFLSLANLQAVFALLFLAPVFIKLNLPDPHNFLLRKFELLLGITYAVFVMATTGVFIKKALKFIDFGKIRNEQLFKYTAIFFLVFYFFISLWLSYANQPTGDEPSYLLVSHSIIYDRDLDLKNNFDNKDYLKFYFKELVPQGTDIKRGDKIFSYHPVLLSVILAPFYFIAGRFGVVLLINAAGAAATAVLFLLLSSMLQDKKAALAAAALTGLTMPAVSFANNISTEFIIAGLIMLSYYLIKYKREKTIVISLIMASMVWIHIRSLPVYAALCLLFAVYSRKKIPEILKFCAIQALSVMLFLAFNRLVLGSFLPSYAGNGGSNLQRFNPANMAAGMLAYFMDRQLGLFTYAPVYIFIIIGAIMLFLRHRKEFFEMLLLFAPYFVMITSWADWGGGSSSPRYFMQVIFIFSACMAAFFKYIRNAAGYIAVEATTAASLLVSAIVMCLPWFRWDRPYAENGMMVMASKILHFDLTRLFPSFKLGGHTAALTAMWLVAIALVNTYIFLKNREAFR